MKSRLQAKLASLIPLLSQRKIAEIDAAWGIKKHLKKGETIRPPGQFDDTIYFVEKGALKMCYNTDGEEVLLELIYEGVMFVSLPFFCTSIGKDFYTEAIRNSILRGISKRDFMELRNKIPELREFWEMATNTIAANFIERQIELLIPSPKLRYEKLLRRRPELFQQIPKKYIATYLGFTAETLSRIQNS